MLRVRTETLTHAHIPGDLMGLGVELPCIDQIPSSLYPFPHLPSCIALRLAAGIHPSLKTDEQQELERLCALSPSFHIPTKQLPPQPQPPIPPAPICPRLWLKPHEQQRWTRQVKSMTLKYLHHRLSPLPADELQLSIPTTPLAIITIDTSHPTPHLTVDSSSCKPRPRPRLYSQLKRLFLKHCQLYRYQIRRYQRQLDQYEANMAKSHKGQPFPCITAPGPFANVKSITTSEYFEAYTQVVSPCQCSLESTRRYMLTGTIFTQAHLQSYMHRLCTIAGIPAAGEPPSPLSLDTPSPHQLQQPNTTNATLSYSDTIANGNILTFQRWFSIGTRAFGLPKDYIQTLWDTFHITHPFNISHPIDPHLPVELSTFLMFLFLQAFSPLAPCLVTHNVELFDPNAFRLSLSRLKQSTWPQSAILSCHRQSFFCPPQSVTLSTIASTSPQSLESMCRTSDNGLTNPHTVPLQSHTLQLHAFIVTNILNFAVLSLQYHKRSQYLQIDKTKVISSHQHLLYALKLYASVITSSPPQNDSNNHSNNQSPQSYYKGDHFRQYYQQFDPIMIRYYTNALSSSIDYPLQSYLRINLMKINDGYFHQALLVEQSCLNFEMSGKFHSDEIDSNAYPEGLDHTLNNLNLTAMLEYPDVLDDGITARCGSESYTNGSLVHHHAQRGLSSFSVGKMPQHQRSHDQYLASLELFVKILPSDILQALIPPPQTKLINPWSTTIPTTIEGYPVEFYPTPSPSLDLTTSTPSHPINYHSTRPNPNNYIPYPITRFSPITLGLNMTSMEFSSLSWLFEPLTPSTESNFSSVFLGTGGGGAPQSTKELGEDRPVGRTTSSNEPRKNRDDDDDNDDGDDGGDAVVITTTPQHELNTHHRNSLDSIIPAINHMARQDGQLDRIIFEYFKTIPKQPTSSKGTSITSKFRQIIHNLIQSSTQISPDNDERNENIPTSKLKFLLSRLRLSKPNRSSNGTSLSPQPLKFLSHRCGGRDAGRMLYSRSPLGLSINRALSTSISQSLYIQHLLKLKLPNSRRKLDQGANLSGFISELPMDSPNSLDSLSHAAVPFRLRPINQLPPLTHMGSHTHTVGQSYTGWQPLSIIDACPLFSLPDSATSLVHIAQWLFDSLSCYLPSHLLQLALISSRESNLPSSPLQGKGEDPNKTIRAKLSYCGISDTIGVIDGTHGICFRYENITNITEARNFSAMHMPHHPHWTPHALALTIPSSFPLPLQFSHTKCPQRAISKPLDQDTRLNHFYSTTLSCLQSPRPTPLIYNSMLNLFRRFDLVISAFFEWVYRYCPLQIGPHPRYPWFSTNSNTSDRIGNCPQPVHSLNLEDPNRSAHTAISPTPSVLFATLDPHASTTPFFVPPTPMLSKISSKQFQERHSKPTLPPKTINVASVLSNFTSMVTHMIPIGVPHVVPVVVANIHIGRPETPTEINLPAPPTYKPLFHHRTRGDSNDYRAYYAHFLSTLSNACQSTQQHNEQPARATNSSDHFVNKDNCVSTKEPCQRSQSQIPALFPYDLFYISPPPIPPTLTQLNFTSQQHLVRENLTFLTSAIQLVPVSMYSLCHVLVHVQFPTSYTTLSHISHSEIILTTSSSTRLSNVKNSQISLITRQLVVTNCHNVTLYLFTTTPPIIHPNCTNITIAPYNVPQFIHNTAPYQQFDEPSPLVGINGDSLSSTLASQSYDGASNSSEAPIVQLNVESQFKELRKAINNVFDSLPTGHTPSPLSSLHDNNQMTPNVGCVLQHLPGGFAEQLYLLSSSLGCIGPTSPGPHDHPRTVGYDVTKSKSTNQNFESANNFSCLQVKPSHRQSFSLNQKYNVPHEQTAVGDCFDQCTKINSQRNRFKGSHDQLFTKVTTPIQSAINYWHQTFLSLSILLKYERPTLEHGDGANNPNLFTELYHTIGEEEHSIAILQYNTPYLPLLAPTPIWDIQKSLLGDSKIDSFHSLLSFSEFPLDYLSLQNNLWRSGATKSSVCSEWTMTKGGIGPTCNQYDHFQEYIRSNNDPKKNLDCKRLLTNPSLDCTPTITLLVTESIRADLSESPLFPEELNFYQLQMDNDYVIKHPKRCIFANDGVDNSLLQPSLLTDITKSRSDRHTTEWLNLTQSDCNDVKNNNSANVDENVKNYVLNYNQSLSTVDQIPNTRRGVLGDFTAIVSSTDAKYHVTHQFHLDNHSKHCTYNDDSNNGGTQEDGEEEEDGDLDISDCHSDGELNPHGLGKNCDEQHPDFEGDGQFNHVTRSNTCSSSIKRESVGNLLGPEVVRDPIISYESFLHPHSLNNPARYHTPSPTSPHHNVLQVLGLIYYISRLSHSSGNPTCSHFEHSFSPDQLPRPCPELEHGLSTNRQDDEFTLGLAFQDRITTKPQSDFQATNPQFVQIDPGLRLCKENTRKMISGNAMNSSTPPSGTPDLQLIDPTPFQTLHNSVINLPFDVNFIDQSIINFLEACVPINLLKVVKIRQEITDHLHCNYDPYLDFASNPPGPTPSHSPDVPLISTTLHTPETASHRLFTHIPLPTGTTLTPINCLNSHPGRISLENEWLSIHDDMFCESQLREFILQLFYVEYSTFWDTYGSTMMYQPTTLAWGKSKYLQQLSLSNNIYAVNHANASIWAQNEAILEGQRQIKGIFPSQERLSKGKSAVSHPITSFHHPVPSKYDFEHFTPQWNQHSPLPALHPERQLYQKDLLSISTNSTLGTNHFAHFHQNFPSPLSHHAKSLCESSWLQGPPQMLLPPTSSGMDASLISKLALTHFSPPLPVLTNNIPHTELQHKAQQGGTVPLQEYLGLFEAKQHFPKLMTHRTLPLRSPLHHRYQMAYNAQSPGNTILSSVGSSAAENRIIFDIAQSQHLVTMSQNSSTPYSPHISRFPSSWSQFGTTTKIWEYIDHLSNQYGNTTMIRLPKEEKSEEQELQRELQKRPVSRSCWPDIFPLPSNRSANLVENHTMHVLPGDKIDRNNGLYEERSVSQTKDLRAGVTHPIRPMAQLLTLFDEPLPLPIFDIMSFTSFPIPHYLSRHLSTNLSPDLALTSFPQLVGNCSYTHRCAFAFQPNHERPGASLPHLAELEDIPFLSTTRYSHPNLCYPYTSSISIRDDRALFQFPYPKDQSVRPQNLEYGTILQDSLRTEAHEDNPHMVDCHDTSTSIEVIIDPAAHLLRLGWELIESVPQFCAKNSDPLLPDDRVNQSLNHKLGFDQSSRTSKEISFESHNMTNNHPSAQQHPQMTNKINTTPATERKMTCFPTVLIEDTLSTIDEDNESGDTNPDWFIHSVALLKAKRTMISSLLQQKQLRLGFKQERLASQKMNGHPDSKGFLNPYLHGILLYGSALKHVVSHHITKAPIAATITNPLTHSLIFDPTQYIPTNPQLAFKLELLQRVDISTSVTRQRQQRRDFYNPQKRTLAEIDLSWSMPTQLSPNPLQTRTDPPSLQLDINNPPALSKRQQLMGVRMIEKAKLLKIQEGLSETLAAPRSKCLGFQVQTHELPEQFTLCEAEMIGTILKESIASLAPHLLPSYLTTLPRSFLPAVPPQLLLNLLNQMNHLPYCNFRLEVDSDDGNGAKFTYDHCTWNGKNEFRSDPLAIHPSLGQQLCRQPLLRNTPIILSRSTPTKPAPEQSFPYQNDLIDFYNFRSVNWISTNRGQSQIDHRKKCTDKQYTTWMSRLENHSNASLDNSDLFFQHLLIKHRLNLSANRVDGDGGERDNAKMSSFGRKINSLTSRYFHGGGRGRSNGKGVSVSPNLTLNYPFPLPYQQHHTWYTSPGLPTDFTSAFQPWDRDGDSFQYRYQIQTDPATGLYMAKLLRPLSLMVHPQLDAKHDGIILYSINHILTDYHNPLLYPLTLTDPQVSCYLDSTTSHPLVIPPIWHRQGLFQHINARPRYHLDEWSNIHSFSPQTPSNQEEYWKTLDGHYQRIRSEHPNPELSLALINEARLLKRQPKDRSNRHYSNHCVPAVVLDDLAHLPTINPPLNPHTPLHPRQHPPQVKQERHNQHCTPIKATKSTSVQKKETIQNRANIFPPPNPMPTSQKGKIGGLFGQISQPKQLQTLLSQLQAHNSITSTPANLLAHLDQTNTLYATTPLEQLNDTLSKSPLDVIMFGLAIGLTDDTNKNTKLCHKCTTPMDDENQLIHTKFSLFQLKFHEYLGLLRSHINDNTITQQHDSMVDGQDECYPSHSDPSATVCDISLSLGLMGLPDVTTYPDVNPGLNKIILSSEKDVLSSDFVTPCDSTSMVHHLNQPNVSAALPTYLNHAFKVMMPFNPQYLLSPSRIPISSPTIANMMGSFTTPSDQDMLYILPSTIERYYQQHYTPTSSLGQHFFPQQDHLLLYSIGTAEQIQPTSKNCHQQHFPQDLVVHPIHIVSKLPSTHFALRATSPSPIYTTSLLLQQPSSFPQPATPHTQPSNTPLAPPRSGPTFHQSPDRDTQNSGEITYALFSIQQHTHSFTTSHHEPLTKHNDQIRIRFNPSSLVVKLPRDYSDITIRFESILTDIMLETHSTMTDVYKALLFSAIPHPALYLLDPKTISLHSPQQSQSWDFFLGCNSFSSHEFLNLVSTSIHNVKTDDENTSGSDGDYVDQKFRLGTVIYQLQKQKYFATLKLIQLIQHLDRLVERIYPEYCYLTSIELQEVSRLDRLASFLSNLPPQLYKRFENIDHILNKEMIKGLHCQSKDLRCLVLEHNNLIGALFTNQPQLTTILNHTTLSTLFLHQYQLSCVLHCRKFPPWLLQDRSGSNPLLVHSYYSKLNCLDTTALEPGLARLYSSFSGTALSSQRYMTMTCGNCCHDTSVGDNDVSTNLNHAQIDPSHSLLWSPRQILQFLVSSRLPFHPTLTTIQKLTQKIEEYQQKSSLLDPTQDHRHDLLHKSTIQPGDILLFYYMNWLLLVHPLSELLNRQLIRVASRVHYENVSNMILASPQDGQDLQQLYSSIALIIPPPLQRVLPPCSGLFSMAIFPPLKTRTDWQKMPTVLQHTQQDSLSMTAHNVNPVTQCDQPTSFKSLSTNFQSFIPRCKTKQNHPDDYAAAAAADNNDDDEILALLHLIRNEKRSKLCRPPTSTPPPHQAALNGPISTNPQVSHLDEFDSHSQISTTSAIPSTQMDKILPSNPSLVPLDTTLLTLQRPQVEIGFITDQTQPSGYRCIVDLVVPDVINNPIEVLVDHVFERLAKNAMVEEHVAVLPNPHKLTQQSHTHLNHTRISTQASSLHEQRLLGGHDWCYSNLKRKTFSLDFNNEIKSAYEISLISSMSYFTHTAGYRGYYSNTTIMDQTISLSSNNGICTEKLIHDGSSPNRANANITTPPLDITRSINYQIIQKLAKRAYDQINILTPTPHHYLGNDSQQQLYHISLNRPLNFMPPYIPMVPPNGTLTCPTTSLHTLQLTKQGENCLLIEQNNLLLQSARFFFMSQRHSNPFYAQVSYPFIFMEYGSSDVTLPNAPHYGLGDNPFDLFHRELSQDDNYRYIFDADIEMDEDDDKKVHNGGDGKDDNNNNRSLDRITHGEIAEIDCSNRKHHNNKEVREMDFTSPFADDEEAVIDQDVMLHLNKGPHRNNASRLSQMLPINATRRIVPLSVLGKLEYTQREKQYLQNLLTARCADQIEESNSVSNRNRPVLSTIFPSITTETINTILGQIVSPQRTFATGGNQGTTIVDKIKLQYEADKRQQRIGNLFLFHLTNHVVSDNQLGRYARNWFVPTFTQSLTSSHKPAQKTKSGLPSENKPLKPPLLHPALEISEQHTTLTYNLQRVPMPLLQYDLRELHLKGLPNNLLLQLLEVLQQNPTFTIPPSPQTTTNARDMTNLWEHLSAYGLEYAVSIHSDAIESNDLISCINSDEDDKEGSQIMRGSYWSNRPKVPKTQAIGPQLRLREGGKVSPKLDHLLQKLPVNCISSSQHQHAVINYVYNDAISSDEYENQLSGDNYTYDPNHEWYYLHSVELHKEPLVLDPPHHLHKVHTPLPFPEDCIIECSIGPQGDAQFADLVELSDLSDEARYMEKNNNMGRKNRWKHADVTTPLNRIEQGRGDDSQEGEHHRFIQTGHWVIPNDSADLGFDTLWADVNNNMNLGIFKSCAQGKNNMSNNSSPSSINSGPSSYDASCTSNSGSCRDDSISTRSSNGDDFLNYFECNQQFSNVNSTSHNSPLEFQNRPRQLTPSQDDSKFDKPVCWLTQGPRLCVKHKASLELKYFPKTEFLESSLSTNAHVPPHAIKPIDCPINEFGDYYRDFPQTVNDSDSLSSSPPPYILSLLKPSSFQPSELTPSANRTTSITNISQITTDKVSLDLDSMVDLVLRDGEAPKLVLMCDKNVPDDFHHSAQTFLQRSPCRQFSSKTTSIDLNSRKQESYLSKISNIYCTSDFSSMEIDFLCSARHQRAANVLILEQLNNSPPNNDLYNHNPAQHSPFRNNVNTIPVYDHVQTLSDQHYLWILESLTIDPTWNPVKLYFKLLYNHHTISACLDNSSRATIGNYTADPSRFNRHSSLHYRINTLIQARMECQPPGKCLDPYHLFIQEYTNHDPRTLPTFVDFVDAVFLHLHTSSERKEQFQPIFSNQTLFLDSWQNYPLLQRISSPHGHVVSHRSQIEQHVATPPHSFVELKGYSLEVDPDREERFNGLVTPTTTPCTSPPLPPITNILPPSNPLSSVTISAKNSDSLFEYYFSHLNLQQAELEVFLATPKPITKFARMAFLYHNDRYILLLRQRVLYQWYLYRLGLFSSPFWATCFGNPAPFFKSHIHLYSSKDLSLFTDPQTLINSTQWDPTIYVRLPLEQIELITAETITLSSLQYAKYCLKRCDPVNRGFVAL